MTTEEFIQQYRACDVADLALRVRQFPEVDAAFALQQIEGQQRALLKLPTLAEKPRWQWPVRLSLEQCSSEATARYKAEIVQRCISGVAAESQRCGVGQVRVSKSYQTGIDLTGGLGIDTFFLSEHFQEWHYVEMQPDLAAIAAHNFAVSKRNNIQVHNTTAEAFLSSLKKNGEDEIAKDSVIFVDPARRNQNGGKVFRLSDCTPDVTTLYPTLIENTHLLVLKLSPMLDISEALTHLPDAKEVHIVALHGEVKEVLILCSTSLTNSTSSTSSTSFTSITSPTIHAINLLPNGRETFSFTREEEASAEVTYASVQQTSEAFFLYEPNVAILKAGAFRLVSARFGLQKLAPNTHLYASQQLLPDFPGRIFKAFPADKETLKLLKQANVICRNHPLKPEELKRKYKLKDGGEQYLIGCRVADKPTILLATREK